MATATVKPTGSNVANNDKKQKTALQSANAGALLFARRLSQQDLQPMPPPEPRPAARPARPQPLELKRIASQESLCGTPDILTPKDQLVHPLEFNIEDGPPALRDGAPRPNPHSPHDGAGGDEDRLQGRDQAAGTVSAGFGVCDGPTSGRPPKPKVRVVEPPMPCNPYMARSVDGRHCFQSAEFCVKPESYSRFLWDYHQEAELGHGNFSKVYRAVHRLTGVAFAVKTNRNPITTLHARNMWLNEMQALAAVQGHPHIVRLHDTWFEPDARGIGERVFIKMELCGDSLAGLVKRRLQLSEQGALDMLRQMASALKRIHELGMVHLDIKPDNIYPVRGKGLGVGFLERAQSMPATSCGGIVSGSGAVYKLGDFGLAMLQGRRQMDMSEGDCRYLAPEALRVHGFLDSGMADRLDIFALGASAYELLRGSELPKNGPEYSDLRSGRIILPGVDARLVSLLKRMMAPVPAQRPTADQVLKSPLLIPGIGGGSSPVRRQSTPVALASSLLPGLRRGVAAAHRARRAVTGTTPLNAAPYPLGPNLMSLVRRSISCTR